MRISDWSSDVCSSDLGNVDALNETAKYYRYIDCSRHAEFLYECVEQTLEHDLPEEVRFLKAFDAFNGAEQQMVDMPSTKAELLRKFLAQNEGGLSAPARQGVRSADVYRDR